MFPNFSTRRIAVISAAWFAGVVATAIPNALASESALEVSWTCIQGDVPTPGAARTQVPETKTFLLKRQSEFAFDLTPILDLMRIARQSGTDFFDCFSSKLAVLQSELDQICFDQKPGESSKDFEKRNRSCRREISKSLTPLKLQLAELGESALKEGKSPPIVPMDPVGQSFDSDLLAMKLKSSCSDPYAVQGFSDLLLSREFVTLNLPGIMDRLPGNCREKVVARYLRGLAELQPSPEACPSGSPRPECQRVRKGSEELLRALSQYGYGLDPLDHARNPIRDLILPCYSAGKISPQDLRNLATAIKVAEACVPLDWRPGGHNQLVVRNQDSGSGIPAAYRLTRTGDKSFVAEINFTFVDKAGKPGKLQEIWQFAQSCLANASLFLKGPNGEQLTLKPISIEDTQGIPKHPVKLDPKTKRASARAWTLDIDCPTVIHESLHVLGLVDEYEEKMLGHQFSKRSGKLEYIEDGSKKRVSHPELDCRAVGPRDSMMHDQGKAVKKLEGAVEQITCECPSGCGRLASSHPPLQSCPPGSKADTRRIDASKLLNNGKRSRQEDWAKQGLQPDGTYVIRRASSAPGSSLLLPAHFRAITQPGCTPVNQDYYACAQFAYKTSRRNFGKGCYAHELPPACRNGASDWLIGGSTR